MKIAISADGPSIDATIHERFGRCPHFLIVETDDMRWEVLENTHADLSSGAGIQAASRVVSKGVAAVITGNCGPKAMQVFAEAGIQVILKQRGVVREAVEKFKDGARDPSVPTAPPATSESGRSFGPSAMGMGGGRGVGGCGRGMRLGGGRGMGRWCRGVDGSGSPETARPPGDPARSEALTQLQQQADACKQRLADIEARIKALR